jgi:aerobic carbon-monoxide dehydrogenase large subunit
MSQYVGRAVQRKEDARLLRGQGLYVADVDLEGMLHLAVLRSPHAHARVLSVDVQAARQLPGVLAAVSFADLPDPKRLPMLVPHAQLRPRMPYPLAADRVLYVGEPVAAVVADTSYQAEDALAAIDVEYEPLPAVVDPEAALESDAPLLHAGASDNVAAAVTQEVGDFDTAFQHADQILSYTFRSGRLSGQPLETRGVAARSERTRLGGVSLTVWDSTQSPHTVRRVLADMLGLPMHAIRVIAPEVGGGFGIKNRFYPEEFLVPYLARLLERPVRWIEDRREDLLSSYQAREQVHHVEVAAQSDGTILGLRDRYVVDNGAYSPFGLVVPFNAMTTLPGPYRLRNYRAEMRAAYTNKAPNAPYRAAGRPPAVFVMERVMDLVARQFALDPATVRLKNMIRPDEFPYATGLLDRDGTELTYDSGDYPGCLEDALARLDVAAFREQQSQARQQGRWLGLGIGCYVESTGRGPFEGATVRVQPSGQVLVLTGAAPQGQSHETTLAQLCADRLGVRIEDVTVVTGDTDAISLGIGTFASRTAVVAGNAVSVAAAQVRAKTLRMAALLLEVSPDDLEIEAGVVGVKGAPERTVTLARVAQVLSAPPPAMLFGEGLEPGLEATHYYHPTGNTFAGGVHVATVEVDAATGQVSVLRYIVVHDCGTIINPMVLDGQVVGGVAQGLGNALYEEMVYDPASGQPLTTSLMDYLLPTSMEVPSVEVLHRCTPSPLNPEGIKGAGEGGTMPVPATIANAIDDALAPLGVTVTRVPLSPAALLALIREAQSGPR